MSKPYMVFVGDLKEHLHPMQGTADEATAVEAAKRYQKAYKFVEAVFMPENDSNTNTVIYKNY